MPTTCQKLGYEERQESIALNLGETMETATQIEAIIKGRLDDPSLNAKAKAGLRQILRTTGKLQRTIKGRGSAAPGLKRD